MLLGPSAFSTRVEQNRQARMPGKCFAASSIALMVCSNWSKGSCRRVVGSTMARPQFGRRYSIFHNSADIGALELTSGLDDQVREYSRECPVVLADIELQSVRLLELTAIQNLPQGIAMHVSDFHNEGAEQTAVRAAIERAIQQVLWRTQRVSQFPPELSQTDWGELECCLSGTARWYFKRQEQ
jgi:hypothetical protein